MSYKLRILSLGAGVQSTTLYLMAEKGLIEPFHCAIFADTGNEPPHVYKNINDLKRLGKCPIIIVHSSNIFTDSWDKHNGMMTKSRSLMIPAWVKLDDRHSILRRKCTEEYKINPIKKKIRELLGLQPRQRAPIGAVQQIIGISSDEMQRVWSFAKTRMSDFSFPLVDLNWSRWDCLRWLKKEFPQLEIKKSACIICPFRQNKEWRVLDNGCFKEACSLDNKIRNSYGFKGQLFLHKSCKPLEEVDLSTPEERGQQVFDFCKDEKLNLFVNKLSICEEEKA